MELHIQSQDGLDHAMRHLLYPSVLDIVYIAIHVEIEGSCHDSEIDVASTHSQVGISIYDSRQIDLLNPRSALETYSYIAGPYSYYRNRSDKFSFGTGATWISPNSILENINRHIPEGRDIVFVFHGADEPFRALQKIGFQPHNVLGALDTACVAAELDMGWSGLGHLLGDLGVANVEECVWNSGNEANYTLRALMLMAIKGYEERVWLRQRMFIQISSQRMDAFRALALRHTRYNGPTKTTRRGENKKNGIAEKISALSYKLEREYGLEVSEMHEVIRDVINELAFIDTRSLSDQDWELIGDDSEDFLGDGWDIVADAEFVLSEAWDDLEDDGRAEFLRSEAWDDLEDDGRELVRGGAGEDAKKDEVLTSITNFLPRGFGPVSVLSKLKGFF